MYKHAGNAAEHVMKVGEDTSSCPHAQPCCSLHSQANYTRDVTGSLHELLVIDAIYRDGRSFNALCAWLVGRCVTI